MDSDCAHSATSTRHGILKLPSKIRKAIFREVLVVPHEIHIFHDPGSPLEAFAPDAPFQWRALLFTDRMISREAAEVLYGSNKFNIMESTTQQARLLEAFIRCIGCQNAGFVSHVCINFPIIERRADTFELQEDGEHTLHLLKENCRGLTVLEFHVGVKSSNDTTKTGKDDEALIDSILSALRVKLETLYTLRSVIVRFFVGRPTPSAMRVMLSYGWKVLPAYRKDW